MMMLIHLFWFIITLSLSQGYTPGVWNSLIGSVAFLDSKITVNTEGASAQLAPQNYARSFHMVIAEEKQNIHLWARNLDRAPYFRQTVEAGGLPVSHQIYRYGERTLYTAELGADNKLVWSKTENAQLENIGISNIVAGPGVWAAQYGTG